MRLSTSILMVITAVFASAAAFDVSCNSNYASYYGQNSARNQKSLGTYCQDATEDVIVLSFMNGFPNLLLNFANACETTFPDSTLLHCPDMAKDIKLCQSKGKAVVLSMGGASGAYGFSSDSEATTFADTVWNKFFKGTDSQRPFDDAVLDGIDLDIEGGGATGYKAFIDRMRSHYASDSSKKYYIAAAPQCPYPDAYLGSVMNNAWFDMVYVQFYNNYCGLNAYPSWFNYADWDNWAKTVSVNKNVKIYIGAPGGPSAASSGYVDAGTLQTIYSDVRSKYSSLGGIMTWDVSQARTSGLAGSIRSMLDSGGSCGSAMKRSALALLDHEMNILQRRADPVEVSKITKPNLRPKPVKAAGNVATRAEFVAGDIVDNKYSTVVKVATLQNAFSGHWSISFTLPAGQTVDSSSRGTVSVSGNTVTIKSDPAAEKAKNMAAIFKITGTFSGDYALPDTSSAKFTST
ncbi:glycoside hydrolase [Linderina pennispora]|uniref:chitinase n=1 Tax=Linderina pennispora TaxID=61395 RepID=A0A1Y1W9L6_9FUNG|nr:glycoside hydrolase [Linderina pennispora]ORX70229.1 glycoside hydrolase [Linderina pennispora]